MMVQPLEKREEHLTDAALLEMYRSMVRSRRLDERAWAIHRQGRIAFHVSAIGHEAAQVAAAFAIRRGIDYVAPYYRDLAMMIALGMTPTDFLKSLFGKDGEVSSGARQMGSHFSNKALNIVSISAAVATQVAHAAGLAFAIQYKQRCGLVDPHDETQPRLALTCIGEGSTSQGDFLEAMNWMGVHKLPMIMLVQNNQYAISVRVEKQMAVANVADRAPAFGVPGVVVDGNDVLAMYSALRVAAQRAYDGDGGTLVEAKTYRMTPHSSDDDDRTYRSYDEVEEWKQKDPILRFRHWLLAQTLLTDADVEDIDAEAVAEVDLAQVEAEEAPYPPPEAALGDVYA